MAADSHRNMAARLISAAVSTLAGGLAVKAGADPLAITTLLAIILKTIDIKLAGKTSQERHAEILSQAQAAFAAKGVRSLEERFAKVEAVASECAAELAELKESLKTPETAAKNPDLVSAALELFEKTGPTDDPQEFGHQVIALNIIGTYVNASDQATTFLGPVKNVTIINNPVATREPATVISPHQLPSPPADFTGRGTELGEMLAAVADGGLTISGLRGLGGVGKTALALVVAHRLAKQYADAQFYLDLRGTSKVPVTAAEALAHVIRGFQSDARLPEDEAALAPIYRSVLHGKRALLLMDNAAGAAQVAPLIPPEGCLLIVTSRMNFTLPGLKGWNLDALPEADAEALLRRICPRLAGAAGAAGKLARLCGRLPLALRLAASALEERRSLTPEDYLRRLGDARKRLELADDSLDLSVEASLSMSYDLLAHDAVEASGLVEDLQLRWRLLGVFPADFDAGGAAAVWEIPAAAAEEALAELLRRSLLEFDEATGRFRLHDLLRDLAGDRMSHEEREAAAGRHARHYQAVLREAGSSEMLGGEAIRKGLDLFDRERPNIEAGRAWAASHAEADREAARLCSDYPDRGTFVISLRLPPREQIAWRTAALAAARKLKDRAAEGRHLGSLGLAYYLLGEYRRAIEFQEKALAIDREIGDRRGEGQDLGNLGNAYRALGEHRRAIEFHEKCLAIARELGDRRGEGAALGNLGIAYQALGEYRRAIEFHEKSLAIAREIGDRRGEGAALGNLGNAYDSLGEYRRAIEFHEKALAIAREIGDRQGEGNALGNLGNAYRALGEHRRAIEFYEKALAIGREIGDRSGEGTGLYNLGLALWETGKRTEAISCAEASLKIFEDTEAPDVEEVRETLARWRKEMS